jgi:hypothetical protein
MHVLPLFGKLISFFSVAFTQCVKGMWSYAQEVKGITFMHMRQDITSMVRYEDYKSL